MTSRGAETTVETLTGSTAPVSLVPGRIAAGSSHGPPGRPGGGAGRISAGAGGEPHGLAVLGVAHELARQGGVPAQLTAELADGFGRARGLIQMHVLAGERRATAVRAAAAIGPEGAQPPHQEAALELLEVLGDGRHRHLFRRLARRSSRWARNPRSGLR